MLNRGVLLLDAGGRIRRHSGTPPLDFNGGTPTAVALAAAILAPAIYAQGAPYLANGALCVNEAGAVSTYSQGGLPLVATGEVAVDGASAISFYNAGLPYCANGKLAVGAIE